MCRGDRRQMCRVLSQRRGTVSCSEATRQHAAVVRQACTDIDEEDRMTSPADDVTSVTASCTAQSSATSRTTDSQSTDARHIASSSAMYSRRSSRQATMSSGSSICSRCMVLHVSVLTRRIVEVSRKTTYMTLSRCVTPLTRTTTYNTQRSIRAYTSYNCISAHQLHHTQLVVLTTSSCNRGAGR